MRRLQIYLTVKQIEWFKAKAASIGISMAEYVRRVLDDIIEAQGEKK